MLLRSATHWPTRPSPERNCWKLWRLRRREAGHVLEQRLIVDRLVQVEHGGLRVDQRRQLRHDQLGDGLDVFLTLQHAGEARQVGLEPVLLGVDARRVAQVADHFVDVFRQLADLAARIDLDRSREVALGDGGCDAADRANLRGELRGELVDVVGEVFPQTGGARHDGLSAELSFEADFARDGRHLIGEAAEGDDHAVDRVGEFGDLALGFERQLTAQVAVRDAGDDARDAADLFGEVTGHLVDGVGEIFPRAGDARHLGLTAELPFGADFARDARDFAGERVQLVDHRVDGVFELEDLAAHVDGDLLRKVAVGDGRRDLRDVADLRGEVRGHRVDRVGEVLPRTGDARHDGLTAELPLRTDLARDARDFEREAVELVDHRVDGVLELEDLAAHVDDDLLREVAVGDGGRDLGDVADLVRQVARPSS